MIVDDNPGDAHLLQFWLERFGCIVKCAKDGNEAIDLFKQRLFDFILMDLDMPSLDGHEATKAIRVSEAELDSPRSAIIAISGLDDKQLSSQCQLNGMDGYFSKPVCPRELAFALAEIRDGSPTPNALRSVSRAYHVIRNKK